MDDVIFSEHGKIGVIVLNRPKVLNALSVNMAISIATKLREWERTKSLVIVKGAGGKAFCAGGDVRTVYDTRKNGDKSPSLDLQQLQFVLCNIVKNYKIPYVALMDGVVMGAGNALCVHGTYRVATEKTLFAMPEASIGFIPDVGASYFLPRLEGKLGWYLALTAGKLKGADVLGAGIASHYCQSTELQNLENDLLKCDSDREIKATLDRHNEFPIPEFTLRKFSRQIDECFDADKVEDIMSKLQKDGSEWAKKTLKQMEKISPTSLKVVLKEMNIGSRTDFKSCMQMEYRLAANCLEKTDFYEGVRALLIDKDMKPKWKPSKLSEISDEYVDEHFKKTPTDIELRNKL